ncbi:MAG TPA: glycosyltransferase family 2 protein [Candidatus Portnoybacteria bacterium]|nr:glycosyltransferase family 2 protein [Candidatus Portnoybacteria bacterium]
MEKNKLVSINILTYNGQDLIKPCLKSVLEQTYPNLEILIIDNASSDGSVGYLKKNYPQLRLIENKKNLGFSVGHNMAIKKSRGEFILCLNQDVVLDRDFIKKALAVFKEDKKIGAVQGKLLRSQTGIIDTTGLIIFRNRRIISRGQGKEDRGQYEKKEEIFGVDGAAPIYRRSALEDIKINSEYFDEDFFLYKEDVDLAWRMRLAGWKSVYQPEAVGYHLRGSGDSAATSSWRIIQERRKISGRAKYYSWKNQRLMQIKNEYPGLFLKDFMPIIWKEIRSLGYIIIFEPYLFKSIGKFFLQLPQAWQKRKTIMSRKRAASQDIGKWFR